MPCGTSRETVRRSEPTGGGLRVLRGAFPLALGLEAVPNHEPGRDARGMAPSQPEDQVSARSLRNCPRTPPGPGRRSRPDPDRGQGIRGPGLRGLVTTGSKMNLVRLDRRDGTPRHGSIGWIRRWIESVNDTHKGQLDLERHGGGTPRGRLRPRRPAPAGHGQRDLAHLGLRRPRQAIADRLRQLNPQGITHPDVGI